MKLNEGLRKHDLIDLVHPKFSIDEYESKIDDDAIVVGIFVDDSKPAEDLSNFIEYGQGEVLDTEVSPAPNDDGDYVVFIEFLRDDKFPGKLEVVLDSLESLTGLKLEDWKFEYYKGEEPVRFSKEAVEENIRLEKPEGIGETADDYQEFFRESILDNVTVRKNFIVLERYRQSKTFQKIALGEMEEISDKLALHKKPFSMTPAVLRECKVLREMLGHNWDVNKLDDHYVLANNTDNRIMVLK
jgi:hypothetical protein